MNRLRVRIVLEAPWSPEVAARVDDTLRGFEVDVDAYDFLVVWRDVPGALTIRVRFEQMPECPKLVEGILVQNLVICFPY